MPLIKGHFYFLLDTTCCDLDTFYKTPVLTFVPLNQTKKRVMNIYLKIGLVSLGIILSVAAIVISTRVRKDIKKKLAFENTYAIQNVSSGMCVRPFDAGYKNGNSIIGYSHKDWV